MLILNKKEMKSLLIKRLHNYYIIRVLTSKNLENRYILKGFFKNFLIFLKFLLFLYISIILSLIIFTINYFVLDIFVYIGKCYMHRGHSPHICGWYKWAWCVV